MRDASTPFAWTPPDESSPFFVSSEVLRMDVQEKQLAMSPSSGYPRVKKGPDPAFVQMKSFFTGMFASVNSRGGRVAQDEATLEVSPKDPSLKENRELAVTYTVRNTSKKMSRIEFPTSQRIEIITRNPTGGVIERWSDDRSFQPQEGIVIINPKERIEYQEKISTRDMKPGQTYSIDASLATQPDFAMQQQVTPR